MSTGAVGAFVPTQPTLAIPVDTTGGVAVLTTEASTPITTDGTTDLLTSTGSTAFAIQDVVLLYNSGNVPVFVSLGTDQVLASVDSGMPIPPGADVLIGVAAYAAIAMITSSGSAILYMTPGIGTQR